jgi:cysteine-S-conjugate beta-lyase
MATLGDEIRSKVIVCTSGSKTFNLAGMHTSNIIVADPERRTKYEQALRSSGLFSIDLFGKTAQEAAYNHGEEWLEQLLDYLTGNLEFLKAYLAKELPQLSLAPLEGTYLAWVDCRQLELSADELKRLMIDVGRVYLDEGVLFGPEGEGFERINLACSRSVLKQALDGIKNAVQGLSR